jgi:hypothetical protein
MPSREQLALRKTAAFERLNGTLAALSDRLGIDTDAIGGGDPVKNPDLAAVVYIEQIADALDAIDGAVELTPAQKKAIEKRKAAEADAAAAAESETAGQEAESEADAGTENDAAEQEAEADTEPADAEPEPKS